MFDEFCFCGCGGQGGCFAEIRDSREDEWPDDEMDPDEYDDGDYPGVEQDENMSRIEGDDFWFEAEPWDVSDGWG